MRKVVVAVMVGSALLLGCSSSEPALDLGSLPAVETTPTTSEPAVASTANSAPSSTAPVGTTPLRTWAPATANLTGLASECGNMSYVTARPDRDMLIAGIARRGLWSSADGGATWAPLGQGPGSATIVNRPSAIIFDPVSPDTFWEGGIYGDGGAFRTDDNGTTFTRLGDLTGSDLLSVDLTDPQRRTLLAGLHETSIVMRSGDGGDTWQDVSAGLPAGIGQAVAPHVIDAQTHLLGTKADVEAGVFRTTDGGATWTRVHTGGINGAPVVSRIDGAIFWLLEGGGGLIRSDDAGATWTTIAAGVGKNAASLLELPDGRLATYGDSVIVSDDSRTTFAAASPPLPYEPNGMAYSPFRKAFYVWRFDCSLETDNPIAPDAIMQVTFDHEVE